MSVVQTEYKSEAWTQARKLRYELFFKEHQLPENVTDDEFDATSFHAVSINNGEVEAYGRLTPLQGSSFLISQMVVAPARQSKGLGGKVLEFLLTQTPGSQVKLNARLPAVDFYSKFGFIKSGDEFLSSRTGVPHVLMIRSPQ